MADAQTLQFYLADPKPDTEITLLLGELLGFAVESVECEVPDSIGFVQVMEYSQGFRQGLLVTWLNGSPALPPQSLLTELARRFGTSALLEPEVENGKWLLATPSGELEKVTVTTLEDGIGVERN